MVVFEFFFYNPFDSGRYGPLMEKSFERYDCLMFTLGINFDISVVEVLYSTFNPELIGSALCIVSKRHTLYTPLNDVMIRLHRQSPVEDDIEVDADEGVSDRLFSFNSTSTCE
jgi:hypothetical protein